MADECELLQRLGDTVGQVIGFFEGIGDAGFLVNSSWTARDALVHVVFWHESFARNVSALACGDKPVPLKGTYAQLAQRAGDEAAGQTIHQLLERLAQAQRAIEDSILDPRVVLIPYKAGSRPYTPAEHLSVVNEHVAEHLRTIKRRSTEAQGARTL